MIDASSVGDIRHHFCEAMSHFGFDNTLYAARFLSLPETVLHEEIEIFSNYPKEFTDALSTRRLLTDSQLSAWTVRNAGSIALQDLVERSPDDPVAVLIRGHRMQAGRVISLKDKVLRSHGAIMLNPFADATSEEAEFRWLRSHHEIGVLSWVMHMRMATILRRRSNNLLTNRQREVLEWSSAGKTVAEIATILGVTPATIEKHLRLARDALDAGNTAQAILKAHLTHQLFPEPRTENDLG
ncbi:helix-turn-helix transcriptional regulator [Paracoccus caeni]|uniref:helix-turn-helix transcriptional regulator n=1 Tax=Paracoccus caeni TaxID=657651 RepID=UPI00190915F1|nr:LuxR family transcriptional regulator [Paracoccus caeni]